MRSFQPLHPPVLLLAFTLAAPLSAQVPGLRTAPAAAPRAQLTVEAVHLQSLQTRLNGFAAGLTADERALWDDLLRRAATAPTGGGEVRVSPILQIGPGGGCEDAPGMDDAASRVAIIVEGGRAAGSSGIIVQGGRAPSGIIVQGGRTPVTGGQGADGPRPNPTGVVAIGPKQDDPSRPGGTGAVAIGPKQDDPSRPGGTGAVAIGPKQDDPAPPPQSLGRRIAELSAGLPAQERGALEWLLTRAAQAPEGRPGTPGGRPGTPGGLASTPDPEGRPGRPATVPAGAIPGGRPGTPGGMAPGRSVSLRQALGIDPLAIGPKQDDPTPPPPATRWMLRY